MRLRLFAILSCLVLFISATSYKEQSPYTPRPLPKTGDIVVPASLRAGDKIAIVSPASRVDSAKVNRAIEEVRRRGFEPVVMPHAYGRNGSYAATDQQRADDLMAAFADPEIAAILCARGGYGCTRILPLLDVEVIRDNPKWLIGYSDISALHALLQRLGIASIHGPMMTSIYSNTPEGIQAKAKATAKSRAKKKRGNKSRPISVKAPKEYKDTCADMLFDLLQNGLPYSHQIKHHAYNKLGSATGRLIGGNLIVINELAKTPYDIVNIGEEQDAILFIEEVGEQVYAVERLLLRMHLSGELSRFKAIILGDFTEYKGDEDFSSMYDMIYRRLKQWGYYDRDDLVIVYGMPSGHGSLNYPLALGAMTTVIADRDSTTIVFRD